ncbi:hypothetical protein MicvaDRAFT_4935 [Microcoleus vaginatus FGP-2]|nr:hypothetical protein MicvaDRAFT_4935 [Microcoleus vaginatus FGP-2]
MMSAGTTSYKRFAERNASPYQTLRTCIPHCKRHNYAETSFCPKYPVEPEGYGF